MNVGTIAVRREESKNNNKKKERKIRGNGL